jgi:protein-disulfide isomerase
MNKTILFAITAIFAGGVSAGLGYYAGNARASASIVAEPEVVAAAPMADTAEIEAVVRNYLLKNPEIMIEVQTALQTKQNEQGKLAANKFITEFGKAIFSSTDDAVIGNPNGDVTVVEFFDYNCGYCRRAMGDMQALIKTDPSVRFVLKELPILGPDSVKAHNVAQAFKKMMPEKYGDYHVSLLGSGHADEDSAIALAVSMGADEAKLRSGMEDKQIAAHFEENNKLATGLNITGTPSYVIMDEVVPGALGLEVLTEKVANVRACQKATC